MNAFSKMPLSSCGEAWEEMADPQHCRQPNCGLGPSLLPRPELLRGAKPLTLPPPCSISHWHKS